MPKPRLIAIEVDPDDTRDPHQKFSDFVKKVINVPKAELNKREEQWQQEKR